METLKIIFAWIGVAASLSAFCAVALVTYLKYEDRKWRERQDGIDRASGSIPANDN